ncbi:MAG: right-handed parallel beta-helix repeat-containing protein [Lentisphaeria bacterium]|jgi:parallel beta-helix repeat protein|nr:right-handed parallel beta-helix repeat-containing protein [Lentisphaeria bacterium]
MRLLPFGCLALAAAVCARETHVSPQGDDANPGTRQQPLRTVAKALDLARGTGPGTIWLAPGEYYVENGLELGTEHGGTAEAPLEIRSDPPRQARLTGARRVTGFARIPEAEAATLISPEARRRVLVADLAAQGFPPLGDLPLQYRAPGVEEVIFGNQPMQSARWPNEDFTAFTEVIDAGASDPVHWVTREVYRPGSFRFPDDRAGKWDLARGVYLHGFWCYEWSDETLKADTYDPETRELRLAAKHGYGIGNPRQKDSKREFYAIHVFEELDRPGEYYLDRQHQKLYFWPPGDLDKTPVFLSLCRNPLLKATGSSHLVLRDLVFENGCGNAVELQNCQHARVENCLVRNMGLSGVMSSGGSDNHVVRCEITRVGVRAVGMTAGDRKTLTSGNCSVVGNHLHDLGRYDWQNGRGVNLGGCGNRVAHNLIHHCPTGGVSYSGNEHLLELNEVHHVCLVYGDVGVFYTGRDWASQGNVVRWNYIHSIVNRPGGSGSQAIYLDDCDSGDTVVGNIVFGGVGRGVLLGGGRDNTIRGNLFIGLPKGIHVDARGPRAITLDRPGSWNLRARAEEVDYLSPLWRERYPRLARVLDEEPLLPMGNVLRDNIFVGCKEPFALAKDVKEEWLGKKNNALFEMADFPFLPDPAKDTLDLAILPRIWKKVPNFAPIPFHRIGPKGME